MTARLPRHNLPGHEPTLITALTDAVAQVYGEWARDLEREPARWQAPPESQRIHPARVPECHAIKSRMDRARAPPKAAAAPPDAFRFGEGYGGLGLAVLSLPFELCGGRLA